MPNSDEDGGITDRVAQDVFLLLSDKSKNSDGMEATVQVSYMELYKEELRDLLELHTIHKELHIREDERGNTGNENVFFDRHVNLYFGTFISFFDSDVAGFKSALE